MTQSTGVIAGNYLKDILAQPQALRGTLEALRAMPAPAGVNRGSSLVLTGMGSSCHAFHPMLVELGEAGIPATLVETSELIHYRRSLLAPDAVVVALSQSGRSAEIVRLLELSGEKPFLIGVTNDLSSPLAQRARITVPLAAGAESAVSTKTYLASLVALSWLSEALRGGDLDAALGELDAAPRAVAEYLERWEEHVRQAIEELRGIGHLFLAGRGPSLAAVGTGGLITKESTHVPAEGMSAAAFRHGPMEMVGPRVFVLVFEGDRRTGELNRRLCSDVKEAGGKSALVSGSAEPGPFRLPAAPPRIRPVLEILPVQMMTLALAALRNREAGVFTRSAKVTETE